MRELNFDPCSLSGLYSHEKDLLALQIVSDLTKILSLKTCKRKKQHFICAQKSLTFKIIYITFGLLEMNMSYLYQLRLESTLQSTLQQLLYWKFCLLSYMKERNGTLFILKKGLQFKSIIQTLVLLELNISYLNQQRLESTLQSLFQQLLYLTLGKT